MSSNTFPEFNIDDLTGFDTSYFYSNDLGYDGVNWDQSSVAGPSQPYAGVDVFGDVNGYPDFPSPSTAPISLHQTNGELPDEGKSYSTL